MDIRFMSCTFPGEDVQFHIVVSAIHDDGLVDGQSEEFVGPVLDDRFEVVSEDTYEFDGTFEDGCKVLLELGFEYVGAIDGAMEIPT